MADPQAAVATQLRNIEAKTGKKLLQATNYDEVVAAVAEELPDAPLYYSMHSLSRTVSFFPHFPPLFSFVFRFSLFRSASTGDSQGSTRGLPTISKNYSCAARRPPPRRCARRCSTPASA